MSFNSLLIHTVDVTNVTEDAGTPDRYGNPEDDLTVTAGVPCRVQPASAGEGAGGSENLQDRDTRVTRFRIFFLPSAPVTATSTLTWLGRTLRVSAEPKRFYDASALHHIEADAEEVKG